MLAMKPISAACWPSTPGCCSPGRSEGVPKRSRRGPAPSNPQGLGLRVRGLWMCEHMSWDGERIGGGALPSSWHCAHHGVGRVERVGGGALPSSWRGHPIARQPPSPAHAPGFSGLTPWVGTCALPGPNQLAPPPWSLAPMGGGSGQTLPTRGPRACPLPGLGFAKMLKV